MDRNTLIGWKLHAKTQSYKNHVKQAIGIIHKANKIGVCAISWSGGKDSTAMTHLIKTLYPETYIITQFDDCDWPEKKGYVERVVKKYGWDIHEVIPDSSVWDMTLEHDPRNENICSKSHSITKKSFLKPLQKKQIQLGCGLIYLGLRNAESKYRLLNNIQRGDLYQLKNKEWHCCPISHWSTGDVFAYHIENNIEINPCYFYNRFNQPEQIRLSWALPSPVSLRYGETEHIRYYYPKQFQRLRERGLVV